MERIPVDSSNITAIGYDEESSTLEVEFHSGSIYQYFDVPLHVYEEFISTDSKGQYFAQHIKGFYRFAKI